MRKNAETIKSRWRRKGGYIFFESMSKDRQDPR